MPGKSIIRNEQQADLFKQLEKAGAPLTTRTGSLDALKENSSIARETLEVMGEQKGAIYNFSARRLAGTRGTRTVK